MIFNPETFTMRVLIASLVAWCGQATNDINIVASTYEAFSTDFTLTGSNLHTPSGPAAGSSLDSLSTTGKLQFDMTSKKLKLTATTSADVTLAHGRGTVNGSVASVLLVDVGNSKVYLYESGSANMSGVPIPGLKTICKTKTIPAQKVQMINMYLTTSRLTGAVAMANSILNMMPHTTADGVATFTKAQGTEVTTVAIKTSGVPVSISATQGTESVSLSFSGWESSTGDMSAPTCTPSELDEEFVEGVIGVTDIARLLEVHPVIEDTMSDVSEMLYGPEDDNSGFWTLATVFCISGMAGASLVLAFVKISARKNYQSSPLLAEV